MAKAPDSEKRAEPAVPVIPRRDRSMGRRGAPHPAHDTKVRTAMGMPRAGDTVAGKYRVDQMLGMGGMGAVFSATHVLTGKRVALKWLLPGSSEGQGAEVRLLREAKATARIEHPNVVNVFDLGRHAAGLFLVMELLRGESLGQRLDRGRVPAEEALGLLMPALRGVAAAHAEGVIHRDLKPDNIFLCCDDEGRYHDAKVLDFGISKLLTGEELSLTASGVMLGTPCYMSPEQIRGDVAIDERVDVYALGVILYELLADKFPFEAESYSALLFQIAMEGPRPILQRAPGLEGGLAEVVMKAMAKEPRKRFQDVRSLALALEPYSNGVCFEARSTGAKADKPRGKATLVEAPQLAVTPALEAAGPITEPSPPPVFADGPGRGTTRPVEVPVLTFSEELRVPMRRLVHPVVRRALWLSGLLSLGAGAVLLGSLHLGPDGQPRELWPSIDAPTQAARPAPVREPAITPPAPAADLPSGIEPSVRDAVVREGPRQPPQVSAPQPRAPLADAVQRRPPSRVERAEPKRPPVSQARRPEPKEKHRRPAMVERPRPQPEPARAAKPEPAQALAKPEPSRFSPEPPVLHEPQIPPPRPAPDSDGLPADWDDRVRIPAPGSRWDNNRAGAIRPEDL